MKKSIFLLILLLIPGALAEVSEHAGFPKEFPVDITTAITIADINNDSIPEIIVANIRSVYVYSPAGNLLWNAVAGARTTAPTTSPLVADVNGDGLKEVVLPGGVFGSAGTTTFINRIYIFSSSGGILKTYELGTGYYASVPAFANGLILVGLTGNFNGLYAYDMAGLKWTLPFPGGSERMNSIAVGDLDGDGTSEAVFAGGGKVTAVTVTASGGNLRWQKDVPGAISPVIINVKGKKVVVASGSSGTFAWDAAGVPVWSSNAAVKYYFDAYSSPAVSDLNKDGSDDVILVNDYTLYALSGIDGSMLPGFPVSTETSTKGAFKARPAVYDINGDSSPEIIIGDSKGNLYIWNSNGVLLEGFPVRITEWVKSLDSSPAVYDLEGDGTPEVAIGSATHLHVVSVKVKSSDTTPPVTTDSVDGAWHNSSVTITLTVKDEESGVKATYYTLDGSEPTENSARGNVITLSDEGLYTIKYFSVDNAGNVEEVKTAANQVKIDKTPPSTIDNSDGRWHNGSVVVTFTPGDDGSGIRDTYYVIDNESTAKGTTTTISREGIHSIKYFSIDNAGNVEQIREALVKIDSTPPLTVDDSDNRWHNTDVTLNITASDNLSGIAFIRYKVDGVEQVSGSLNVQLSFNSERVHIISYSGVDNAGNAEDAKNTLVKIDKTPPSTTDDSDGEWHNSSVTVKLTAYDNLAGVYSTSYKVNSDTKSVMSSFFAWLSSMIGYSDAAVSHGDTISLSDEGVFSIQYNTIDNAVNREPEKTSKQVKIDRTLPVITVNTPEAKTYLHSDIITLSFTSQDALSGIKTMNSAIDTRQVSSGQLFDMLELSVGTHGFTITAMDNAGNLNSQKVNFNVIATIDSVKALTERGASNGWISNKGVANSLSAKLNSARAKLDAGQKAAAKNILEAYINEVEAQTNKGITQAGANVLIAEARYVIDTI